MNLEQMKARLAAIVAQLGELQSIENMSDADVEQLNGLSAEFEGLKGRIEAREKADAIVAQASASAGRKTTPAVEPRVQVITNAREEGTHGFKSAGEFFKAVVTASGGQVDQRLLRNATGNAQEKYGEDGGFLIPADFRTEIQKKVTGDESLLSRCRTFKTSSNQLVLPVNEVAPWDGTGVQAYWEGEGATHTGTKTKFGILNMRLNKITALVNVTEELLEDAPALESYIRMEAPDAILHKINAAIISGDGVGKPQGFLNSLFKYKVAKESGQAADTVLFENIAKMESRMLPGSLAKAVWLINPAVKEKLRLMKFDSAAASPVPVYLPGNSLAGAPHDTLSGRPLIPMMGGVKALGDEGDISFVDLSYYIAAYKTTGIKQDVSTHIYFDRDLTCFKFQMRVAGQCPYKAPVTTENGAYSMSGIVTLEDR